LAAGVLGLCVGGQHYDSKGHPYRPSAHFGDSVCRARKSPSNAEVIAVIAELVDWLFDNSTIWVWEDHGAIQGFSAADPRDGSICALFVHPSYEGRGIGRALLPLACDILKASGHAMAVLTTAAATRAERFYRTDGWTEIGRKEDGQIIFQKNLPT
jgi:GNAT superfamily N-acetyltransferase